MEIVEAIYKGVVTPSYEKYTREESNRSGHSRKNSLEAASSKTYPVTDESAGKRRKQYVDC